MGGFQRRQERGGNGGHAGRSNDGGFGPFERGDFFFGDGKRGIAVTRIDVGLVLAFGPKLHFLGRGKGEGGGTDNLRHDRSVDAAAAWFAGVNGPCLGAERAVGVVLHNVVHLGGRGAWRKQQSSVAKPRVRSR